MLLRSINYGSRFVLFCPKRLHLNLAVIDHALGRLLYNYFSYCMMIKKINVICKKKFEKSFPKLCFTKKSNDMQVLDNDEKETFMGSFPQTTTHQSPATPIGRGLMKTPRRGQKTSTRTFLNITQLFEFSKKLSTHALEHAYFLNSNLKTNKLAELELLLYLLLQGYRHKAGHFYST